MGKIINKARAREAALDAKRRARRDAEAEMAFIQALHAAYGGGRWGGIKPLLFVVGWVGFLGWFLYVVIWR